jgi:hypothetical protein
MIFLPLRAVVAVAVVLAATWVAGCTSTGTTGDSSPARNSRGGGWENFRAEGPAAEAVAYFS